MALQNPSTRKAVLHCYSQFLILHLYEESHLVNRLHGGNIIQGFEDWLRDESLLSETYGEGFDGLPLWRNAQQQPQNLAASPQ